MIHSTAHNERGTSIIITIIFSGFLAFAYGFGVYLFPILSPEMKRDLGFSYAEMGYFAACIQAGFIFASIISGALALRFGATMYIVASMFFCSFCLFSLSLVANTLSTAAILLAIGFVPAATWTPMVSVIGRFVPFERRGLVFGFLSGSGGYGAILNGQVIPSFLEGFGWRPIWLGTAILVFVFTAASIFLLNSIGALRDKPQSSENSNIVSMGSLLNFDKQTKSIAMRIWLIMALGAAIMIPFQTYFTAYIREDIGADPILAGKMTLIHGVIGILSAPVIGYLADRMSIRFCFSVVVFNTILACLTLLWATSIWSVVFSAIFFGLAFYPFFSLPPAYVSKTVGGTFAVFIFAIGNVCVGLGALAGNLMCGFVFRYSHRLVDVFIFLALLTVFLAVVVWTLKNEKSPRSSQA